MFNMKNITILLITIAFFSGCSIFKPKNDISEKRITSFSFNYSQDRVFSALIDVLQSDGFKITQNDLATGEITTDTKKIKDDDDVLLTLKSIAEIPNSPVSEYSAGAYYLFIKIEPDKNKTKLSLRNYIEASERGRYNRNIKLESNGGKEKEILSKVLKAIK
jgi:uncharacterized lipoprotein